MMAIRTKRYGQIELTEMLMDTGDVPKMLFDLQATPTHVEYDFQRRVFRMIVVSRQLPPVEEGAQAPLRHILLNQVTEKFEFDL